MPTYILDTGILLGYVRGAGYAEYIEKKYAVSHPPNIPLISIVSKGEIYSLAIQFGWGDQKKSALEKLLNRIPFADINSDQIIQRYAEIDAYSHGKHPTKKWPEGGSPRNMGKNDLWIAATASVLNATLLSIDHDFDHLDGIFLKVIYIDQKATVNDVAP
ncbi:MAG: PIN domain-containing protein [Acidobacteriia bacterium]|nr:PIN domain-containing protein [Terriglobia bacterium]